MVANVVNDVPFLLIGCISSPEGFARRSMLRSFAEATAGPPARRVRTEFIFGERFFARLPPVAAQRRLADEARRHHDAVFVDGRERLPHVGKATEKSAAWWLSAPRRSGARFFCKTDDDSLLHHEHLTAALAAADRQARGAHVFFSYIRWRGWEPFHRFQACGGGWGGPIDTIRHLEDPKEHCELAEGPFPQGTGALTCLSASLARELANSTHFTDFLSVAKARNDFGAPCATAKECAVRSGKAQGAKLQHAPGLNMWHHEDAGISYNVWRVANERRLRCARERIPKKALFYFRPPARC